VILNLILNAMEATQTVHNERELLISTINDGTKIVHVSVQDNGTGFPPEKLDHVFDAFYTTKAEGMGMGLTISRSIVESHGGRIWATPVTPHGAVVQFTLPVDEGESA
jgi:signal transduction histidine kinase